VWAHGYPCDEGGQGIEVEVRGHHAPEPARSVLKRSSTRNARNSLVVENVRLQPHEPASRFRLRVPRPDARIVRAAVLRQRQSPRVVGQDIVLDRRRLPIHDSSLPDALSTVDAISARKCAGLVAKTNPAKARVALQEDQELTGELVGVTQCEV